MDEYRQSVLGRALADALQALEAASTVDPRDGDEIFALFDDAMRELLPAAQPTHEALELRARTEAYNRFLDKWSLAVALQSDSDEDEKDSEDADDGSARTSRALVLDGAQWPLPHSRMLVKLHKPPPPVHQALSRKRVKRA